MKDLKHENEWGRVMGPVTGALKLLAAVLLAVSPEAWVLYAIVFLWQFPHFMAIAWMYREDYNRAGYLVLPRGESSVVLMVSQAMIPLLVLVPLSVTPVLVGRAGLTYFATALVLGGYFIYRADE